VTCTQKRAKKKMSLAAHVIRVLKNAGNTIGLQLVYSTKKFVSGNSRTRHSRSPTELCGDVCQQDDTLTHGSGKKSIEMCANARVFTTL
jgi:hypothetical protein